MSPENEVVDYYANEGVGYAQKIFSRYMIRYMIWSLMRRLIKIPRHSL
jgi:hypothetical protein